MAQDGEGGKNAHRIREMTPATWLPYKNTNRRKAQVLSTAEDSGSNAPFCALTPIASRWSHFWAGKYWCHIFGRANIGVGLSVRTRSENAGCLVHAGGLQPTAKWWDFTWTMPALQEYFPHQGPGEVTFRGLCGIARSQACSGVTALTLLAPARLNEMGIRDIILRFGQ
jgi:hypothetical protein